MTDIYARLSHIVAGEIGADGVAIGPETELDDLPGWDSVALAGVLLAIESEFEVGVTRQQIQHMSTGADLARLCAPASAPG